MLIPKKENVVYEITDDNKILCKFKGGTRIVTWSKNLVFEEPVEECVISADEAYEILNQYNQDVYSMGENDLFKRAVYSKWIDENDKEHSKLMYAHLHH